MRSGLWFGLVTSGNIPAGFPCPWTAARRQRMSLPFQSGRGRSTVVRMRLIRVAHRRVSAQLASLKTGLEAPAGALHKPPACPYDHTLQ